MESAEELAKQFYRNKIFTVDYLAKLIEADRAEVRKECAERALVYYCQEVCFEDDEKQNAACRKKGGCKWANKLKAAIMAEPPKAAL